MSKSGISSAARAGEVPVQGAVLPELPTWPVVKCAISPVQLRRINMAMKDRGDRRRADLLRTLINEGLKSLGY